MIDMFLKVAYERSSREKQDEETISVLQKLPVEELAKIASGERVAWLDGDMGKKADENTFLSQFKGTPLFEQAVALEQEELQAEMADLQRRQQKRMEPETDRLWDLKDGIRLKKKLLELELAKSENGLSPEAPAQGAGAPAGESSGPEGVQQGAVDGVGAKTAAAATFSFADRLGREMARSDMRKAASVQGALALGDAVGRLMAKEAFNPMPMLQNAGRAAMGFARANPQAAGALAGGALGAAGGAVAGGPNHRLSGALGGGLLGAGAGAFGGGTAARMQGGAMGFGDAASAQARSWAGKAQSVADRGGQLMQGTAPAPNMLHNRLQVG